MQQNSLEQAIFRTVAYFSLFDYPLTAFEIWKWLFGPGSRASLFEVRENLEKSEYLADRIKSRDGFWSIEDKDIQKSVRARHENFLNAVKKYRVLKRVARYLSWIPSVRGIAACNTLAWDNTRVDSDVDIFIIVREGSIWTSRLFAVTPFKILRMRPGQARDPLCFTFFITDTNLDVSSLALEPSDPYLTYWSRSLVPVFDRDGVFEEFTRANGWAGKLLPNSFPSCRHRERSRGAFSRSIRFPAFVEKISRQIQKSRFPDVIQNMANRDSRVVISDAMLKFHDNDRRAEYRDKLAQLIERI